MFRIPTSTSLLRTGYELLQRIATRGGWALEVAFKMNYDWVSATSINNFLDLRFSVFYQCVVSKFHPQCAGDSGETRSRLVSEKKRKKAQMLAVQLSPAKAKHKMQS